MDLRASAPFVSIVTNKQANWVSSCGAYRRICPTTSCLTCLCSLAVFGQLLPLGCVMVRSSALACFSLPSGRRLPTLLVPTVHRVKTLFVAFVSRFVTLCSSCDDNVVRLARCLCLDPHYCVRRPSRSALMRGLGILKGQWRSRISRRCSRVSVCTEVFSNSLPVYSLLVHNVDDRHWARLHFVTLSERFYTCYVYPF